MTVADISQIFRLFSGEQDTEQYNGLLQNSIDMLLGMLKDNADLSNSHLPYAAAAIANYRYTQTARRYAESATQYTAAGTVITEKEFKEQFNHSKSLMLSYLEAIAPLLRDDNFDIINVAS